MGWSLGEKPRLNMGKISEWMRLEARCENVQLEYVRMLRKSRMLRIDHLKD